MKTETLAAFVAIAATTVSATWHGAQPFKCPTKQPEICIPQQRGGFDWADLIPGKFEHHNGFNFKGGWECKDSFGGRKRDALLPRTFRPKCVTAEVTDKKESCPKIEAGSDGPKKFAITKFQVSVEFDCELEFHYTMPDKSTCKQKSHCKKSGTEIENKQCGGATDVVIVMPKAPKEVKKKTCKIGLHKIDFNCPKPGETPSDVIVVPSKTPIDTKPVETSPPVETAPPAETQPAESLPPTSSVTSNSPVETSPVPFPIIPGTCSEEVSKVPSCAIECINNGGKEFGCEKDDYACLCKNIDALPGKIGPCVLDACPDALSVLASTKKVCECIGKQPVESSPAEGTPIETQPAETQPAESAPAESIPIETKPIETPKYSNSSIATTAPVQTTSAPVQITTAPAQSTFTLTTVTVEEIVTTCPVTSTVVNGGITSIETSLTVSTISVTTTKTLTTCDGGCTKPAQTEAPATSGPAIGVPVVSITSNSPQPTTPSTPESPETPEQPEQPEETPETPEGPESPESPESPATSKPIESVTSNSPQPTSPSTPETPETPEGPATPAGPNVPEGPCPPVLPSCLNTWLPEECESNSDVDCFCPKQDFTKDVFECLAAHGATQEEIDSAVEFLQGLCAPFVPVNPGLIVDIPERPEEAPVQTKPAGPVTTIIVDTIITVPCTPEAGTITTSSSVSTVKTQVTVPQVILTTVTGGDVGVVPGTATAPPAVIASTTANAAQPSETAPGQQPAETAPEQQPTAPLEQQPTAPVEQPEAQPTVPAYATAPAEDCEGAECPEQAVPTTFAPSPVVPIGTGNSVGTITRAPAPTAPLFTGAASKGSVGGGILAAALGFAMMI